MSFKAGVVGVLVFFVVLVVVVSTGNVVALFGIVVVVVCGLVVTVVDVVVFKGCVVVGVESGFAFEESHGGVTPALFTRGDN